MKKLFPVLLGLLMFATVCRAAVANSTVEVVYSGTTATVTVAANISSYITVSSGESSHVKLVQSESVGASTGEITYILKGTSDDGEFYLEGSYKVSVELNGLTLANPKGPALNIQDGKRIKVKLNDGTVNTLSDGENEKYNGCLHCKGHTEFRGKGKLNVVGNSKHAIYSKEYIQLKNATINITGAVKDAIHCKEYFFMESGTVNITGAGDDGIQVELDDEAASTGVTTDHEDENTGNFYQENGILNISGYGGKAVKADGAITFIGGIRNFSASETEAEVAADIHEKTVSHEVAESQCFDLQGRRITKPRKGVYIINSQIRIKK